MRWIAFFLLSSWNICYGQPARLFFPVEKNQVQILPQSFEYSLVNKTMFQIGDILIDTAQFHLSLKQSKNREQYRLFFEWPADLIRSGELLFQDSSGKNIWIEKINTRLLKIQRQKNRVSEDGGGKLLRSLTSNLLSNTISDQLFEQLKAVSYFKFCIRYDENGTRIYLCSSDFFLSQKGSDYIIQPRESLRKDSLVEINGKTVDPQGLVFLSELSDNISLRVIMESGAKIEVDTHRRAVRFKDFAFSSDKKSILVSADGTEPADRKQLVSEYEDYWQAKVQPERPTLYLKGEGNIPMKQEFIVNGPVRSDSYQIQIKSEALKKTYSEEVQLSLKPNQDTKLSPKDKKSVLDKDLNWTFLDLKKGEANTRLLDVVTPEGRFVAGYEVVRGYPYELNLKLMLPLLLQAEIGLNLSTLQTLQLGYDKSLTSGSTDSDYSNLKFEYMFNIRPGIRQLESVWGLKAFLNQLQANSATGSVLGIGAYSFIKLESYPYIDWLKLKLELPIAKLSSDLDLKTSYNFEASLRIDSGPRSYLEGGLRLYKYTLSSSSSELSSSKSMAFFGLGHLF